MTDARCSIKLMITSPRFGPPSPGSTSVI
jgi:hypothetical protein